MEEKTSATYGVRKFINWYVVNTKTGMQVGKNFEDEKEAYAFAEKLNKGVKK